MLREFLRSRRPFCIMPFDGKRIFDNCYIKSKSYEILFNFAVSTVSADGLALSGDRWPRSGYMYMRDRHLKAERPDQIAQKTTVAAPTL